MRLLLKHTGILFSISAMFVGRSNYELSFEKFCLFVKVHILNEKVVGRPIIYTVLWPLVFIKIKIICINPICNYKTTLNLMHKCISE